jgi:magnesium-transporting ATPase (P-type)
MTEPISITGDDVERKSADDLFFRLQSSPKGLSSTEAEARLKQYGLNALEEEEKVNLILKLFWESQLFDRTLVACPAATLLTYAELAG